MMLCDMSQQLLIRPKREVEVKYDYINVGLFLFYS